MLDEWLTAEPDSEARDAVILWANNVERDPGSVGGEPIPNHEPWLWTRLEVGKFKTRFIGVMWRLDDGQGIWLGGPPQE